MCTQYMHRKRVYDIGSTRQKRTGRVHQNADVHGAGGGLRFRHVDIDHFAAYLGLGGTGKRTQTTINRHEPYRRVEKLDETLAD